MSVSSQSKTIYTGIIFAILATIIWSGNFIVARGVINQIPPVSLAFYRWLTASLIILPLAFRKFNSEKNCYSSLEIPLLGGIEWYHFIQYACIYCRSLFACCQSCFDWYHFIARFRYFTGCCFFERENQTASNSWSTRMHQRNCYVVIRG